MNPIHINFMQIGRYFMQLNTYLIVGIAALALVILFRKIANFLELKNLVPLAVKKFIERWS